MVSQKPQARREPRQERSRERVELLLDAARRLIGERGNDAVSMREIAAAAGVPVSSVYDYFPDKNAILRRVIVTYVEQIQQALAEVLAGVTRPADAYAASDRAVDTLVEFFEREPALGTIWSAVQANTTLRELDWADGWETAELLASLFGRALPDADPGALFDACLYGAQTVPMTVRAALTAPDGQGEPLLREQKLMLRLRIRDILGSHGPMPTANTRG